jgi:HK97 family phage prohead protease
MKKIKIHDTTLIGNWEEVQDVELSTITKRDTDTQRLNGLVIKGYETKFSKTNENGERYEPGCLDDFIQSYFIDNNLNMVVDLQHGYGIDDQVGRVVYLETNTVGFYFVAYIPRTVARYEQVKNLLQEGILQGFSKCGWASDWEWERGRDGEDVFVVKKMDIVSVSLVTSPANAIAFEGVGETIQNRLGYRNRVKDEADKKRKSILKSNQKTNQL